MTTTPAMKFCEARERITREIGSSVLWDDVADPECRDVDYLDTCDDEGCADDE